MPDGQRCAMQQQCMGKMPQNMLQMMEPMLESQSTPNGQ
jgi:hypothetical protein